MLLWRLDVGLEAVMKRITSGHDEYVAKALDFSILSAVIHISYTGDDKPTVIVLNSCDTKYYASRQNPRGVQL